MRRAGPAARCRRSVREPPLPATLARRAARAATVPARGRHHCRSTRSRLGRPAAFGRRRGRRARAT
eukprot:3421892-Lingulodinium_polyedra.AAC.1